MNRRHYNLTRASERIRDAAEALQVPAHELQLLMGLAGILTIQRSYLPLGDDMADRVRSAFKIVVSA